MSVSPELAVRLVQECKFMRSRVEALLACEHAIDTLAAEDVFGKQYPQFLRDDSRSLTEAIFAGERELGTVVSLRD